MCIGETLNIDSCSKFWGNLEGIWGNPGEIPHTGSPGSIGLKTTRGNLYVIFLNSAFLLDIPSIFIKLAGNVFL